MSEILKHLVIIEPTEDRQVALERALAGARVRDPKPELRLFVAVDGDSHDLKAANPKLYRELPWLQDLTRQVEQEGLRCDGVELCWSTEWERAVLECAERYQPFHIFMPDCVQGRKRGFFSAQQWALMRHSKWPVTVVRPGPGGNRRKMLAAVNVQKEDDPRYARLNEKILTQGMNIAKTYGAEFYVVNAYPDSMNYPDRELLMRRTGLPTQYVHVEQGDPDEVIANYAQKIGADTVVIGTLARKGAMALMKGNTSEKVLRKLNQDVIAYS